MPRIALAILGLGLAACTGRFPDPQMPSAELFAGPSTGATIAGVVTDHHTRRAIPNALVFLVCSCIPDLRETQTDAGGIYRFKHLPPGKFTVQVFVGQADVEKSMELLEAAHFRANFTLDSTRTFNSHAGSEFPHPRASSGHAWALMGPDKLPEGDHPAWR